MIRSLCFLLAIATIGLAAPAQPGPENLPAQPVIELREGHYLCYATDRVKPHWKHGSSCAS